MGLLKTSLSSALAQEVARIDTDLFKLTKETDIQHDLSKSQLRHFHAVLSVIFFSHRLLGIWLTKRRTLEY
jgi:hypothetical protein